MLSIDGLVSGLDTTSLIQQLLELQRRPIALVQDQIATANQKQTAFLDLTAKVLSLKTVASRLSNADTFKSVDVNSSDESVLAASGGPGVPPGVYSFRVAQLASPSQHTSSGFATSTTAVGAGTLSLEYGGFIDIETELSELNGGDGVSRGTFRITDRSGNSADVDISAAITVRDVVDAINNTSGIDVTARVATSGDTNEGRGIVLVDNTGSVTSSLSVEDIDGQEVAIDLGLVGSTAGTEHQGSAIRNIGGSTRLSQLSDGIGVRTGTGDDLQFSSTGFTDFGVDLEGLTTMQQVIDAINDASGGSVTATVDASGNSMLLTSTATGFTVADSAFSSAASDLGIAGTTASTTLTGSKILSDIGDMSLDRWNGGTGVSAGSIDITDRSGASATVSLASADSLKDVLAAINNAGIGITASVNPEGNGIMLRDTTGGTGSLTVAENGGDTAADLGLLGSVTGNSYRGSDVNPLYVHTNTLLSSLNGGSGVDQGAIRITATNGTTFTVDLSQEETIGDVLTDVNGAASAAGLSGVFTAALNDTGNGIKITDTAGGGTLRVDEVSGGTTARDLHLLGTGSDADPGSIDGAFEETITISATDTLEDVQDAIDALNVNASATIVNDGSSNPYRLNIVGGEAGRLGRLLVDTTGSTALEFSRSAKAKDGVLFYGESTGDSSAVLIRSDSNTYTDVIEGLTVTAFQTSSQPTRVTVSQDNESIVDEAEKFVDSVNAILEEIGTLTDFDLETETRGILLGDGTVRAVERQLFSEATKVLSGVSNSFMLPSEVGIRIVNGRLSLNRSEFSAALESDPEGVRKLFTAKRVLDDDTELEGFNNGDGVDVDTSGDDFQIHLRDGTTLDVDITGSTRASDIVDAINDAATAAGFDLTAEISSSANRYILRDGTTGSSTFRVTALNSSSAFNDLGLNKAADESGGGVLSGYEIDLSEDPGVASRISDLIDDVTDTETGILQRRADAFDEVIASLEGRVSDLEDRLATREDLLRRQFAQLEEIISQSQSAQGQLAAQLSTLPS